MRHQGSRSRKAGEVQLAANTWTALIRGALLHRVRLGMTTEADAELLDDLLPTSLPATMPAPGTQLRRVLDLLHELGSATAIEVAAATQSQPPGYRRLPMSVDQVGRALYTLHRRGLCRREQYDAPVGCVFVYCCVSPRPGAGEPIQDLTDPLFRIPAPE